MLQTFKKDRRTGFILNVGEDFDKYIQNRNLVKKNLRQEMKINNTNAELNNVKAELDSIKKLLEQIVEERKCR